MTLIMGNDPSNIARPVSVDATGRVDVNGLMYGQDSGGAARVLLVDASGQPLVVSKNQIKTSGGTWKDQLSNANGAAVIAPEQENILDGINGAYIDTASNSDLSAGANNVNMSQVPTGEIWEITHAAFMYGGTVAGVTVILIVSNGATNYYISVSGSITSWSAVALSYNFYLSSGFRVVFGINGATLHDDFYGYTFGRKIKVS